jgi:hypothetical protein
VPRASTRPGDLGPTDAVRQQVQVSLEKASGTLNASRLQKGLGTPCTSDRAPDPQHDKTGVARHIYGMSGVRCSRSRPDDKEVAVKLVAVMGALGIGALLVLLGLKQKKTRQGSAS